MATIETINCPAGTSGIAVAPWSRNEIYAVAANWANAASPVYYYGRDGWTTRQYQVADFLHSETAALRKEIEEAIVASGDEIDDDEVDGYMSDATDIDHAPQEVLDMVEVLESHGERFTGTNVRDEAEGWIEEGFTARQADKWCEIGVWDAATAARLRDADLTPAQVKAGAEAMVEGMDDEDRAEEWTDGDPIYSVCNNDTDVDDLIDAAEEAK